MTEGIFSLAILEQSNVDCLHVTCISKSNILKSIV
jgi:hypothetical protein